jgi:hypothetical protein
MVGSERDFSFATDDPWYKVVEFLQQNWAYIQTAEKGCVVFFVSDASGVFDRLEFESVAMAEVGLGNNGFSRFQDDLEAHEFIAPPKQPFRWAEHPNGPIYSSGRFWKDRD